MKAIQIEVDDEMLDAMAIDKEVQALGISEFLRATIKSFLKWRTEREIDKQYERVYGDPRVREALEREAKEWIDEQVWLKAAASNPAFDFLKDPAEDIYTLEDGRPFRDEGQGGKPNEKLIDN